MKNDAVAFERKSRDLEMLYDVVANINVSHDLTELLTRVMRVLRESTDAGAAAVRLLEAHGVLRLVAAAGFEHKHPVRQRIGAHDPCICQRVIEHGHIQTDEDLQSCCGRQLKNAGACDDTALLSVPLQYRGRSFGVINLYVNKQRLSEDEDLIVLLTSIGQHLGMAIERIELDRKTERLSRVEERAHLAHELHDSLAQTLASARLQIRLLGETMGQGDAALIREKLRAVEHGVDAAYRELRDLIARFRVQDEDPGVIPSIENVVQRFKEESGIATHFHNDLENAELPPEIESQVVRIVQEALNNARKHSEARMVRVLMRRVTVNRCQVLIEDDGAGLGGASEPGAPGEHLGLSIMRERAQSIGGNLQIESDPNEGTRVHLTFPYPQPVSENVYSEPQQ